MIYQIFSFGLILIFYLSYLLNNIKLKKNKINVNHLGKDYFKIKKIRIYEKILKILTYLMAFIQMFSIIINDNWYIINIPPYIKIIGLIIMIISNIIFLLSIIAMKENWRIGISNDNTQLVITGIYKISRNPVFLSFDLLYIGLLFVFPNPINLLFTIILIWMFDFQIMYEEQYLKIKFGEEYADYYNKVARYFIIF